MCYLSVQCSCKHNIAIPHPFKSCIRPRNPRGCWIIRRGDPLKTPCPGCEEYLAPGSEQPSWKDVKRCHDDPIVEWSELNHYDIISMDRARHKTCEGDRLDLRKRLRWKAMIADGMVAGWGLTERGAMVNTVTDDSDEDYQEHEVMEAVDQDDIEMMLDSDGNDDGGEDIIGYRLQRVAPGASLASISGNMNGNEQALNRIFQVSENSDSGSDASGSDISNEAVNGDDDESGMVTIGYQPGRGDENESLIKLDELFREAEAANPFNPSFDNNYSNDRSTCAPTPPNSPGDPVKISLFRDIPSTPLKLQLKPIDITDSDSTINISEDKVTAIANEESTTDHRDRIDKALQRMRCMQAAYFEFMAPDVPERPPTPTPESTRDDNSDKESEDEDASSDILSPFE